MTSKTNAVPKEKFKSLKHQIEAIATNEWDAFIPLFLDKLKEYDCKSETDRKNIRKSLISLKADFRSDIIQSITGVENRYIECCQSYNTTPSCPIIEAQNKIYDGGFRIKADPENRAKLDELASTRNKIAKEYIVDAKCRCIEKIISISPCFHHMLVSLREGECSTTGEPGDEAMSYA